MDALQSDAANSTPAPATETALPELPFTLTLLKDGKDAPAREFAESEINSSTKYFFHAVEVPVTVNRELRSPEDGGSTRHIEIDIKGTPLQVRTGWKHDWSSAALGSQLTSVLPLVAVVWVDPTVCDG